RYSSTLDRAASIPSAEIVFNLNSIGPPCSCLQALRENSEKQIPRRLQPPRNDKNKALIGTIKVVPFPRLLALPASATTSVFGSCESMRFQNISYAVFCLKKKKIPQQVTCQCSSENCSAVATNENQFIQLLDLHPILQRVAKAMRPVKQRQETQCKQINSGERQRDQRMQILVTRSGNPSQGKRKPEEEKVHRYDESGKDTARAEQRPQNRLIRVLHHL